MKALILIDIQNGLIRRKALYNEKFFFDSVNIAIKAFRDADSKIFFVQHNSNQLKNGTSDWELDKRIDKEENDVVIQKKQPNAFQKTNLKQILLDFKVNSITIGGLVSHGCVRATCLGGLTEGFETSLLKNGHTNWNKDAQTNISETEKELMENGVIINTISNKSFNDLTAEELGQLFPIVIHDYTEKWIALYQDEKQLISDSLERSEVVSIDHIGSTAIPGLMAKPTIDILLQISEKIDIQKLADVFSSLGYQLTKQPDNPPPYMTFVKGYTQNGFKGQAYHVHIRYKSDWHEIRFRDYLINHKEIAKEYEALKLELAERFRNDREAYTNAKTDFIERINKLTGH